MRVFNRAIYYTYKYKINIKFWRKYREEIAQKMIFQIEKIIPNISKHIIIKEIANPFTFYKYTLNKDGAIRGWAAISSQAKAEFMPQVTPL
ncbi:MAG: hypothetical protein NC918_08060 [Candidatus Omnitrophica bacterium]|nr:hypothetical protein [Candidatus Omnitrophota bacterium]